MGLPLRILRPKCNLIDQTGELISEPIDQKVELYFNLMLESTEELKESEKHIVSKLSLKGISFPQLICNLSCIEKL